MVRAQRGEVEAFAGLMDAHLPAVRRFLAVRAPIAHLVDELAHETFLFAFRHLGEFAAGTDLDAWLRAVAGNILRAEVQRFARQRKNLQRYAEWRVLEAAQATNDEEDPLAERLGPCLDRLPSHLRGLIDLKYREDRSSEEMADRLGRSVAWVRTTLFRAREQLRACIQSGGGLA